MEKISSHYLNLSGEYRVCSELLKRSIFATITYGQHKGTDIYAIGEGNQTIRIEVKTSQSARFVTGITQKKLDVAEHSPDFWVLFQLKQLSDGEYEERFFILKHDEICAAQKKRNGEYRKKYIAKHGRPPDFSKGVDNLHIDDVVDHENKWQKINVLIRPHV